MKKLLIILFLFFSNSYAIKDKLIKPTYKNSTVLNKIYTNYPDVLDNKIASDENNVFKYSTHFRIIYGKDYQNDENIKNLADKILQIAEIVWQKEIKDYGFKHPRNSDKYFIDIYIGNTNAYNPEYGYINISSIYDGYATAYSNQTPYFVINPDISENVLKVTMAHEFFHTVQFAYGLDDVNYTIWFKNSWFLEATAVMMEDEVFDDVNDYLNYLPYYLRSTNLPLDYANGSIEYGKVLFAKFIREKYGIEKIKKIFEDYETNETILDDLKKEFNFDRLMLDFAKCLVHKNSCFEEGPYYPDVDFYKETDSNTIGQYGILFINEGNSSYLNSLNNEYLQEDFNGVLNRKIDINQNGLILINKQNDYMDSNIIMNNDYHTLKIKRGWNLVSNIFANELNLTKLEGVVFWVYRNGKYEAYSNLENYKKAIKQANLAMSNNSVYKNEGFWIYSDKDLNIDINKSDLADNDITLHNGWQIVGFSSAFGAKFINAKIIWEYDKDGWAYYSDKDLNYSKIDIIRPLKGYFIFGN
jgi:hypothetical protein